MKGHRQIVDSSAQVGKSPAPGQHPARRRPAPPAPESADERLGRPLAWSSGEPADARHIQRFAEMREAIERRVDGRERRRLHRSLADWNQQLGLLIDHPPANDEEPSA